MAVDEQRGELVWRRAEEFIQRLEGLLSPRRPSEVDWSAGDGSRPAVLTARGSQGLRERIRSAVERARGSG